MYWHFKNRSFYHVTELAVCQVSVFTTKSAFCISLWEGHYRLYYAGDFWHFSTFFKIKNKTNKLNCFDCNGNTRSHRCLWMIEEGFPIMKGWVSIAASPSDSDIVCHHENVSQFFWSNTVQKN